MFVFEKTRLAVRGCISICCDLPRQVSLLRSRTMSLHLHIDYNENVGGRLENCALPSVLSRTFFIIDARNVYDASIFAKRLLYCVH